MLEFSYQAGYYIRRLKNKKNIYEHTYNFLKILSDMNGRRHTNLTLDLPQSFQNIFLKLASDKIILRNTSNLCINSTRRDASYLY